MSTVTSRKPRVKPVRFARLWKGENLDILTLIIGEGEKQTRQDYYLYRIDGAAFGLAFKVEKLMVDGGDVYHVNLDPANGHHSCECLGHVKHGHKTRCKHVASLLALRAAGRLA
jgi:hypothetical protein